MIVAANFKACQTRAKTRDYFGQINNYLRQNPNHPETIVFTPASCFDHYGQGATLGAQNAHTAYQGAFTGETAQEQLDEFGVNTLLVGHSERRELFGETQDKVAVKFDYYKNQGFRIVYCVGEPLNVRQEGEQAVFEYLKQQFEGIDTSYENFVVAYEPIWAIGTGVVPTDEHIENTLQNIKTQYGVDVLYGGSVKPENIASIAALPSCDGVLVGGASLDAASFISIVQASQK